MPVSIRVLDSRIGSSFKNIQNTDIPVMDDSLDDIIGDIIEVAGSKKISSLGLYCHGIGKIIYQNCTMVCAAHGGYGLQLGADDLTFSNIGKLTRLAGRFAPGAVMDIYSCAAADSGPAESSFSGHGVQLMLEIAANTGVLVRASGTIQTYQTTTTTFSMAPSMNVDFGEWEGTVWLFDPKTGKKSKDSVNSR